jgi:hypothetical protein
MIIKVTNFGPVANARLDIAPVTVIIGRNNLGKSFLSQLVFSVISSLSSRRTAPFLDVVNFRREFTFTNWGLLDFPTDFLAEQITEEDTEFQSAIRLFKQGEKSRDKTIESVAKCCCDLLASNLGAIFFDQLERTFGVASKDLVRVGKNKTTVFISMSPQAYFLITFGSSGSRSAKLKMNSSQFVGNLCKNMDLLPSSESVTTKVKTQKQAGKLIECIKTEIVGNFAIARAFYLPAGRGGLMDSWETISTAWTALAPVAIPRGISMPPLPGTSAMFYNILQSLSGRRKGEFHDTQDIFKQILGGDLEITTDEVLKGKRNIDYVLEVKGEIKKINIIHTASMIKELGPLYLIVKEVLRKNDLFIVEEPESHLHPTAQRDFMKVMVSLAERGVFALFTTHSDLLLRSVGHFVRESSIRPSGSNISMANLSVNLIKDTVKGSVSKNVKITRQGAFPALPTFDEITNELYDEELRLDRVP